MIPYGRQDVNETDVAAVVAALHSDFLTTGPAVDAFEAALTTAVGAPCSAVSSGTAALHAAYAATGVGRGDEVVTTPLTFAATAVAAIHCGASIRFADVDDDTLNLNPAAAEAACTPRTRVVAPVDYAGHPADLHGFRSLADARGLLVVEDAAHAIGARLGGVAVGAMSDLTTFSFHPVKTVTTAEGGAVATTDARLHDAIRRFRNHGIVREHDRLRHPDEGRWHQEIQSLGLNYRLPDVLAALGTSQLARLPAFVARRSALVARYHELLGDVDGLRLPTTRPGVEPAWHLFVVRVLDGRRRNVYDELHASGVHCQVHYLPVHRQPLFEELGYRAGICPVAEAAYEEILSLPLHPRMSDDDQDRVVAELRRVLGA